jgi:hypothetical protein
MSVVWRVFQKRTKVVHVERERAYNGTRQDSMIGGTATKRNVHKCEYMLSTWRYIKTARKKKGTPVMVVTVVKRIERMAID